jgi:hypothetical protein
MHANNLRKFNTCVNEVKWDSISASSSILGNYFQNDDSVTKDDIITTCHCAIVYEHDFGELTVIDPPSFIQRKELPSVKMAFEKIAHLTPLQQRELLEVLDQYPEVFSQTPGLYTLTKHRIPSDF